GRRTAGMAGLGCALPEGAVPTGDIAARVGVEPEWIIRRTGIASRRRLAPGATIADLAERAGRAALDDAGVDGADLDAVLVATASADHVMPAAAPLVASRLGATAAMAWDVNLACTGFLAALEQAAALIESGRAEHVLVIAAEALSRVTDHTDRKTAALFGDGAGAAVLSPGGRMRLGHSVLRAQGDDVGALVVGHEDRLVRMDGQVVFQRAVAAMERCCRDVLAAAGLEPGDVDLVVPHQANARITVTLADRLGVPAERVVDAIAHVGNTGAASIPLALDEARRDGRLPDRGLLLLTAFGAGFASGAVLVVIGEAG
ncbi:MAG: 3-oxoacyl-[acyl-carrier-protein] synthase, partial [Baekduia sp.]|nr:3-oxoacyl-[acyl-carrier-protein] synthase [Baekduia sp.]